MKRSNLLGISKISRVLLICLLAYSSYSFSQNTYQKNYFSNGNMKSEGWIANGKKNGFWKYYFKNQQVKKEGHYKKGKPSKYWYFYRKDGLKDKEGHYKNGKKNKWWLFYDKEGNINHKCQLKNNDKNGYCLIYKMNQLIKASKYKEGKKIKEWTDLSSFKKDNNLIELYE